MEKMKYRYTITANGLYVPQYRSSEKEWKCFTKKMIQGDMLKVVGALAEVSSPRQWNNGLWHFDRSDKTVFEDEAVFFTKAIYVMAFIGAAQHWWGQFDIKEVEDVLK
jgi:hypothetical protein